MAEVVVRWGETLLEVAHVAPRRAPPEAPLEAPAVVERGGRLCCLVPEGARGSLVAHGAYRSVAGLEDARELGAGVLVLSDDVSARVELGALTYEVRPTAGAREVPRSIGAGAVPAWIAGSALLHVPLAVMFALAPPRPATLVLDRVAQARRLVRIEEAPMEVLAWGVGGTGERHAESEGAMGTPEERPTGRRYAVPRERRDAARTMARERVHEVMQSVGALGAIDAVIRTWDAPISPYGAEQANGDDRLAALGALMGNVIGSNGGADGLGMRGSGHGGGGRGEGTIGLRALQTLGLPAGCTDDDCQGSSRLALGQGGLARCGEPGGRCGAVPTIRCGGGASGRGCAADAQGSLSREVIRRTVRRHLGEIRFCYEQGLRDDPSLEGRLSVQWMIGADGRVASAALASSDLHRAAVEQCVLSAVRRWSFPTSDGPTGVTYPFTLQAAP